MSIPTIDQCIEGTERKHILLDTCFFCDCLLSVERNEEEFIELVKKFKERNNILVTIYPVALEFFRGSDLLSDFRKKKKFYDNLIDTTLHIDQNILNEAYTLTMLYRNKSKDVSPTDLMLGATLKKYSHAGILLLTRDHSDFPVKIFDRQAVIPMQHTNGGIDTFALFKYSTDKEAEIYKNLLRADKKTKR